MPRGPDPLQFPPLSAALPPSHPSQISSIPNPHHRPIELQSPADLTYLRSNISSAAAARLDLHFPPSASTPSDPMRNLVSTLVQRYLDRTMQLAAPSISVNGNPLTLPAEDVGPVASPKAKEGEGISYTLEPYDSGLSTRLAALYAELERETLAVSRLRRRAPREAAEREGKILVEALVEQKAESGLEEVEDQEEVLNLGEEGKEEWEERQVLYEQALGELRRMVGGVKDGDGNTGPSLMETVGKSRERGMLLRNLNRI